MNKDIEKSIITKYRKDIWSKFTKAIRTYELINDNDKIAVCISGGKDSFLLAKLLQELKRHGKIKFDLDDYGVKVISTKKIKTNRKLMVKIMTMQNSNMLIFYGKTFKELDNTVNNFLVPYISPLYLTERNLDQGLAKGDKIDLVHEKFYEEAMPTYMDFSKKIKEDGSPLSALRIFMGNLKALRKKYDEVTTSQLHKTFFTLKDVENVKRILNTEMRFYDEKMKVIDVLIDYTINNNTKKKEEDEKEPDLDL